MNQTTNTTASIDLAQLDKLPRANGISRNAEYQSSILVFFERELTDDEMRSLHAVLARRSLTSGAHAVLEFVQAVAHNFDCYDSGDDERSCRGCSALIGEDGSANHLADCIVPRAKAYLAAPVHDAAAPSAEQARSIHNFEVAKLARKHAGVTSSVDLDQESRYTFGLVALTKFANELLAGAAAKTEQADGTVINYDTILQRGAAGAGSVQPAAWMLEFDDERVVTTDPKEVEAWVTQHDNPYTPIPLYRAALTQQAGAAVPSRDAGQEEASTQTVQSINMQEAIAPQVQVADINSDPYFRHLLGRTFKSEAARQELATCVNNWHASRLERYRRSPPAVGLSNDRLLDMALLASLTGDPAKLIDYGRSVLSAATHPSPLLGASKILVGDIKMEGPSA